MTKDGLRSAATWANTEMMEICAKKVTDSHQADTLLQTSDLHGIMKEAVMSDSDEAVKIVKTIYENRHLKTAHVEDIVNVAVTTYLPLPLTTFPYISLPFLTFPYLPLPFRTFPYLPLPFPTFPYLLSELLCLKMA